ncbi:MAG: phosphatase PAP2 family protein [Promicromonosporaceae bacterium]|nr:phosphatase PAP2 family protein [Promicromonosporaceae bacterium]
MLSLVVRFGPAAALAWFDDPLTRWIHGMRTAWLTSLAVADARLFSQIGAIAITIVGALCLVARRQRWAGLWLVASVAITAGLTELSKALLQRPRPMDNRLAQFVDEPGLSFPSGHSQFAAVAAGCLVVSLLRVVTKRAQRVTLIVVGAGVVLMVMWSRVYLGVHYPSDTVGSVLLAATWIAATFPAMRWLSTRVTDPEGTVEP